MSKARVLSKLVTDSIFTVDSSNNVGVGSTVPSKKLDVVGIISATSFMGSGANIDTLNASNISSGTLPDARLPATLPALSGANITSLNASNLSSGTLPDARFPATLPAIDGSNLTGISAGGATDKIEEGNTKAEVVDTGSDGHFLVETEGPERLRVTNGGLVDVSGGIHVTENVTPASGRGIEIFEASAGVGQIQSYNRTGGSWDELKLKGSEVRLHTGSTNALTLDLQSSASTLYGTSDGVLNLDTTDSRGAFLRFKENNTSKGWIGCAEGMGGGITADQDDLGLRAVGNIFLSANGAERVRISEDGTSLFSTSTVFIRETDSTAAQLMIQNSTTGASTGDGLLLGIDSNEIAYIYNYENTALVFGTNNTEVFRATTTGQFNVGSGSFVVESDGDISTNVRGHGHIELDSTGSFSSPKVKLFANTGYGLFAGDVQVGGDASTSARNAGAYVWSAGSITVAAASNANIIAGYTAGTNAETSSISATGTANFGVSTEANFGIDRDGDTVRLTAKKDGSGNAGFNFRTQHGGSFVTHMQLQSAGTTLFGGRITATGYDLAGLTSLP